MASRSATLLGVAALLAGCLAPHASQAYDLRIRGLLDLVAAERSAAHELNTLTRGDSPFDPYGLRLFLESEVTDRIEIYSQIVLRDGAAPYVDGAYLMFTPVPAFDTHLLAGKVPWPVGTYAPRTYSNRNPLVGTPLLYQYHTTLLWYEVVPSADALLATSGSGQYGVNYFGYPEGRGMPVVDDSYWDVGVTVCGSERPLEYAMGITAGTPGWGSTTKDDNSGKTVLGRIGLAPLPGLRFGISGAYGPYLIESLNAQLPPDQDVNDFNQKLAMADFEFAAGHLELRAEGALNSWETPTVGDLDVSTGYVELKYSLPFGTYGAVRLDAMRFGEIADSTGAKHTWDSNITRLEVGGGFRIDRNVLAKVVYQRTKLEQPSGGSRRPTLLAAQASIAF